VAVPAEAELGRNGFAADLTRLVLHVLVQLRIIVRQPDIVCVPRPRGATERVVVCLEPQLQRSLVVYCEYVTDQ
jgi:hypothetical protein